MTDATAYRAANLDPVEMARASIESAVCEAVDARFTPTEIHLLVDRAMEAYRDYRDYHPRVR